MAIIFELRAAQLYSYLSSILQMSGIERATLVHAHSIETTDVGKLRERVNGNVPFVVGRQPSNSENKCNQSNSDTFFN